LDIVFFMTKSLQVKYITCLYRFYNWIWAYGWYKVIAGWIHTCFWWFPFSTSFSFDIFLMLNHFLDFWSSCREALLRIVNRKSSCGYSTHFLITISFRCLQDLFLSQIYIKIPFFTIISREIELIDVFFLF
jgi:hypothetical protein